MRRFFSILFWGIVVVVGVPVVGIVIQACAIVIHKFSAPIGVGKSDRREAANSLKLNARWRVSSYVNAFRRFLPLSKEMKRSAN